MSISSYYRLMRFHQPVGILLLWFPTAWALWLAYEGRPPLPIFLLFLAGTILMRSAGCVVNDLADRNIEPHVTRTRQRPLAAQEVSIKEALLILLILLSLALVIVLQLPLTCLFYAMVALMITVLYPFCKRFFSLPQLVLGLAFSMAIPMVYTTAGKGFGSQMMLLMLINTLWILAYDTMYAMVDRMDDLKIGVRSSAVLLADYDRLGILFLQTCFHGLWIWLAWMTKMPVAFYVFWMVAGLILVYQQRLVNTRREKACFKAFLSNVWYGFTLWVGLIMMNNT